MSNGIYAAASGMEAQQQRIDLLSNDVANVNTNGYKSQRLAFSDLVYSAEQGVPVGAGSAITSLGPSLAEGTIQPSDNPLSLALQGPGYFQVKRADGSIALTRDGSFGLDANGNLVTSSGERLEPPIQLPKGTQPSDVSIGADGTVSVGGKSAGKITVVDVPSPAGLRSLGDDLFGISAASGAPAAVSTHIQQGAIETSNVDLAETMSEMIDAQRSFELASRAIKTQDELLDIANQIIR
jgi:flagellar basal-body rod protein FlgG